jgi:TonB family protein
MPYVMHTDRAVGSYPVRREKMRVFGRYSGGVVYMLAAYDRPLRSESFDQFAGYLRGAWALTPKGETSLGGFEGRAYEVGGARGGRLQYELHGEGRVFLTKKHAYFALAFSPEQGRPEVARFLDSLTLGPSPAGERVAEPAAVPRFTPPQEATGTGGGVGEGTGAGGGDDESQPSSTPGGGGARPSLAAGAPARDPNARKAIIVYKPEPAYTEEARRKRVSGPVRLRLVLGKAGDVRDVSVIKSLPEGLTERALDAARYMLFFPALKDGRPASQYVVVEYGFHIF